MWTGLHSSPSPIVFWEKLRKGLVLPASIITPAILLLGLH